MQMNYANYYICVIYFFYITVNVIYSLESTVISGRALHYVFKIAERTVSWLFFRDILGMQVLRHEELMRENETKYDEADDPRWSRTAVGYGIEDRHFGFELLFRYDIRDYELGNDFLGVFVQSKEALANAYDYTWPVHEENNMDFIRSLEGHKFYLINDTQPIHKDPIEKIILACTNLKKSIEYWNKILNLKILDQSPKFAILAYDERQVKLELREIENEVDSQSTFLTRYIFRPKKVIDHKTAYGQMVFSVPLDQLYHIQNVIKENSKTILKDLSSSNIPGKTSVQSIILADPDGHEICFVDDIEFRKVSKFNRHAAALFEKSVRDFDHKRDEEEE